MPELLAPAGSYEMMLAVFEAGADAVYLAGERFGARAYAKNFNEEELLRALDYAHLHNKKIYLTVNTLLKNREIADELYTYLHPYVKNGLDALLVQDWGVFDFVKNVFPNLQLHASTQMCITSTKGAKFLEQQGASRIVLSRELSLQEISNIHKNVKAELEVFAHGALCYSYSGKCLLSSLIGGRSGNRGRCAQPCRLSYNLDGVSHDAEYLLSLKDLSTIDILPQMLEAGTHSFKIEGRMKQKEYAYQVVSLYRKYLDIALEQVSDFKVAPKDREMLLNAGNRCGFTKGYLTGCVDSQMVTFVLPSHKKKTKEQPSLEFVEQKIPVRISMEFRIDQPAIMTLTAGDKSVCVCGETVLAASSRPLTKEEVIKKGAAFGTTPFEVTDLEIELDDNVFYSAKSLKTLRRQAVQELMEELLAKPREVFAETVYHKNLSSLENKKPYMAVKVSTIEQLEDSLKRSFVDAIYVDFDLLIGGEKLLDILSNTDKKVALCLPYVIKEQTSADIKKILTKYSHLSNINYIANDYDGIGMLEELGISKDRIILDAGLYTFSDYAMQGFWKAGYRTFTVPYELNEKELLHRENSHSEMVVYGYLPVMQSAQCLRKNTGQCTKDSAIVFLTDRKKQKMMVKPHCELCYNTIYNSQPLCLIQHANKIKSMNFKGYRLEFVTESKKQVMRILDYYEQEFIKKERWNPDIMLDSYTNGHFKRGVE
ncbi:U32 family peptidase [Eubacterium oxidoreducens]|uniref:Putative protease n=1 Tax=Eubacterium oxidoreducens TaxID=1732 RepID=A0A1G6AMT0_EUBOX|nr:U32 family peptidase [Eubacterium oxidoreducens]SDB09675.1 putative protease [Eubacterium oxidoreducens]